MKQEIQTTILKATRKALATYGDNGINVVPVSMVRIVDNQIWLFNFFMGKTIKNIQENPLVALSCWDGLCGVQIKASVEYMTEGDQFEEAVTWVAEKNPDRVVRGLLILTPTGGFDVSADREKAGQSISV